MAAEEGGAHQLRAPLLTSVCDCMNEPISSLHIFSGLTVAHQSGKASASRANAPLIRVRSDTDVHAALIAS